MGCRWQKRKPSSPPWAMCNGPVEANYRKNFFQEHPPVAINLALNIGSTLNLKINNG